MGHFKINTKEAFKLVEDHVWTILFSVTRKTKDPNELRTKLEPVAQFDKGKGKEHIWNILIFSLGEKRDKNAFRSIFEPIFKINSKEAYKLVEDRVWTILYSAACETKDPIKMKSKLEPVVQIDVRPAAEMIKEVNFPVLVQRPDGSYIDIPDNIKVILSDGIGPKGWNNTVIQLLSKV